MGSTCSYCKKPNHWQAVCSRRIRVHKLEVSSDDDVDSDTEVLNILIAQPVDGRGEDKWTVKCKLQNKKQKFRIDTGAQCNMLTLKDYQMIQH